MLVLFFLTQRQKPKIVQGGARRVERWLALCYTLAGIARRDSRKAGTELGTYTFLAADKLWTDETNGMSYVAVAEDRWPFGGGGVFLAVTIDGAVYVSDLDNGSFRNYCAAGFPQFMEIMKIYQAALETISSMEMDDEDSFKEMEQTLRQQIMKIDSTAIEDPDGFWSTWIEELGYGM